MPEMIHGEMISWKPTRSHSSQVHNRMLAEPQHEYRDDLDLGTTMCLISGSAFALTVCMLESGSEPALCIGKTPDQSARFCLNCYHILGASV